MTLPATTDFFEASIAATPAKELSVRIFDDLKAAEPIWRALEKQGICTPYQRFDWIRAYRQSGLGLSGKTAIIVLFDREQPIALLPLEIVTRFGLRIGQIIGMPISNGDAPVFLPSAAKSLTPQAWKKSFSALPVDLVSFHCVAPTLGNTANPLAAFERTPAPDNFYTNVLAPGDAPYIEQSLPHKRRTNIRRSQRRLSEAFGNVHLHRARTVEQVDDILEVFLVQREVRFAKMGVENIFARPAFRNFFRTLAIEGLDDPRPAISVHALYAGDNIVATSIGAYGPSHYSQYINSTDPGEASRYSLMGVTLSLLVDELREDGITSLDMGLGDFDYKTDWTTREAVFDVVVPVSLLGRIGAPMLQLARGLKRTIKQTPALWKLARAVQSRINGLRRNKP